MFILSSCTSSGVRSGFETTAFEPGPVIKTAIQTNRSYFSELIEIPFEFHYCHSYEEYYDSSLIDSYEIEVLVTNELYSYFEPNEYDSIYSLDILEETFLDSSNKCESIGIIGSKIDFSQSFYLKVDFSTVDFTEGMIMFRVFEYGSSLDYINNEFVSTPRTSIFPVYLYFSIDDDGIEFSTTTFSSE